MLFVLEFVFSSLPYSFYLRTHIFQAWCCKESDNKESELHRLFSLLKIHTSTNLSLKYILPQIQILVSVILSLVERQGFHILQSCLNLVTFLDELFLLTLLSEQLLLTQCCSWLISCILGVREANVTWLERKPADSSLDGKQTKGLSFLLL